MGIVLAELFIIMKWSILSLEFASSDNDVTPQEIIQPMKLFCRAYLIVLQLR